MEAVRCEKQKLCDVLSCPDTFFDKPGSVPDQELKRKITAVAVKMLIL
jgi:hypothetical protein